MIENRRIVKSAYLLNCPVFLACLALPLISAPAQATSPLPQYYIYAGNTHSHTANTWGHGEQYAKPKRRKARAKQAKASKEQGPTGRSTRARRRRITRWPSPRATTSTSQPTTHRKPAFNRRAAPTQPGWRRNVKQPRPPMPSFVAIAGYETLGEQRAERDRAPECH